MTWPETSSWVVGEVVPMPTLPFESTIKAVRLVEPEEVAIAKAGVVASGPAWTESEAQGVVDEMPTAPALVMVRAAGELVAYLSDEVPIENVPLSD